MDYKETIAWKNSIGNTDYDYGKLRGNLEESYVRARYNAEYLLSKIRKDFPNLTVHDISHVDGLWQVASVIIGKDYTLNPLEGFVLGCAFIMHDAVLSYDAVGGVDRLRSTITWKDYYVDFKKKESLSQEEQLYETDFVTIRKLHADYVKDLYRQLFYRDDGSCFYIIEDRSLRKHFGEIICKIAASHHWNYDDVERLGRQLPAPSGFPQEWRINPLKLACILRCADAGHIDNGRAPDYLLELLKLNQVSRNHWIAQNSLSQIDIDRTDSSKAVIKSNVSFMEKDFAAWNVAYDAVRVLDYEIKESNSLLKKCDEEIFQVQSVGGADSREHLSHYIETDGWKPYDAEIHIGNVEGLIRSLGGERLYGTYNKIEIVLRELVQNARDSIVARRKLDTDFEGSIDISVREFDGNTWFSIKDDGVGMSISTIKRYLLNFGSSFWASDLAKKEFEGLNASGFSPIGQFGIGFYSIFMISSKVTVETRRYDASLDDCILLKFPTGLCLRPIISKTRGKTTVSTEVNFAIDNSIVEWKKNYLMKTSKTVERDFYVPYSAVLSNLTCGIDVDVYYTELDSPRKLIHRNFERMEEGTPELAQWMKEITYVDYRDDITFSKYIDDNYARARKIMVNNKCYGIAALNTLWTNTTTFFDVHTIGGLSTFGYSSNCDFVGCIFEEPATARRDIIENSIDMREWAREQFEILCSKGLDLSHKMYLPYVMGKYDVDVTDVMVMLLYDYKEQLFPMHLKDLVKKLYEEKKKLVLPLSLILKNERLENYLDYEQSVKLLNADEYMVYVFYNSGFLSVKEEDKEFPININYCLTKAGRDLGLTMEKELTEKKAVSRINAEKSSAYVISYRAAMNKYEN